MRFIAVIPLIATLVNAIPTPSYKPISQAGGTNGSNCSLESLIESGEITKLFDAIKQSTGGDFSKFDPSKINKQLKGVGIGDLPGGGENSGSGSKKEEEATSTKDDKGNTVNSYESALTSDQGDSGNKYETDGKAPQTSDASKQTNSNEHSAEDCDE